jgi:hypothetical protein
MADDRKVILQIEVDAQESIKGIIDIKGRIEALRKEQRGLNLDTDEGKKTFEAYQAQIKTLTKEQRSLENAVAQTAGAMEFEADSIAANRAELSKLTAEYKNLAKPTKEQTDRIKALSDRLKEQESAIGNNARNVGNYKEAWSALGMQIGGLSPQLGAVSQGFAGMQGGLKTVATGFNTLKGAIISTGIGALAILLGSLIAFMKQTDEGATMLSGVMSGLGIIMKRITGFLAEGVKYFMEIADGSRSFGEAIQDLGKFLLENLINRFKAILIFGDAIGKLFDGDFSGALKTATDATVQMATGITDATGKLAALGAEMAKAAKEAYDYEVALDALDDAQRDLNVSAAKQNQIVQQLIIQAKNKTLTDQERIKILEKANAIEEDSFNKQLEIDKARLKLVKDRNQREQEAINQRQKDLVKELNLENTSEKRKIEIREKLLSINDELAQEQADLEKKIIDGETNYLLLREKNLNKIDALNQKIFEDAEKLRLKEEAARAKSLEEIEAIFKAEERLELSRLENKKRLLQLEIQDIATPSLMRLQAIEESGKLEIEIENKKNEILLQDEKLLYSDRVRIAEEHKIKIKELEAKTSEEIRKEKEKIAKEEQEQNKKATDDYNKALMERKTSFMKFFQDLEKSLQSTYKIIGQGVALASNIVNLQLAKDLDEVEKKRQEDLKKYGRTQADKDRINKQYDAKAEKARKDAAKKQADIQSVNAIINTAAAVVQALASTPPPASFILAALTAATGAVEVATIQKNKSKLAKGGLIPIGGNLHSNGGTTFTGTDGTTFEAERGEVLAVVNRHDAPKLDYLSRVNSVHGNPFYSRTTQRPPVHGNYFADGGLVARQNSGQIQNANQNMDVIKEAMSKTQIVVDVRDIISSGQKRVNVVDRANVTK